MSSPIPSPACHIVSHLVSVPASSRIGYRMIPPRNPSHAIPDTTTSRFLPTHLIAPTASRHASRLTVSPDGSAQGTTPSCSLFASFACPSRSISSAHPSSPLLAPAPTHAANPSHPSHPLRYISSAHLPSRPASSFVSRRASSLVSSRLTACPASRFALLHLIGLSFISLLIRLVHLIHLIHLIHIIYLIGIVPLH